MRRRSEWQVGNARCNEYQGNNRVRRIVTLISRSPSLPSMSDVTYCSPSLRLSSLVRLAPLLALLASGCGGESSPDGERGGGSIPSVEVVETRVGTLPLERRLNGVVQARNQVTIYPEIAGRLEAVFVDNGDVVERGAALARINPRQYEEQLTQAEASLRIQEAAAAQAHAELRQLEAELARTEQLAERDFTSDSELERQRAAVDGARAAYQRAEAQVDQARSTIEERRESLRQTVVRAPVSGRVGRRNAEVGMRVDGSTSLFVVGDLSEMRVRVTLTEEMLNYIEAGQRVRIASPRLGEAGLQAQISRISPFLEESSFTTEAHIDVSNAAGVLTPGMYVDVDVFYGETEEATLIPNSAVFEDPRTGRIGVFVATEYSAPPAGEDEVVLEPAGETVGPGPGLSDPTTVVFREVEVVARGRSSTGINGIDEGEWIVVTGHDLIDGEIDEPVDVRLRAVGWERVVGLQELQQQDLLRQFMDKQQRIARIQGAESAGS